MLPPFFGGAHPCALAVISVWFSEGYDATPLQLVWVPLYVGRTIPHQRGRLLHPSLQHGHYLPISLSPFCLALPAMTQFGDWSHSPLG